MNIVDKFDESIAYLFSKLRNNNQEIPQTIIITDDTYDQYLGNPFLFRLNIQATDLLTGLIGKWKMLARLIENVDDKWYPEDDLICISDNISKYFCYISKTVCEEHGLSYGIIDGRIVIWYKNTQPVI